MTAPLPVGPPGPAAAPLPRRVLVIEDDPDVLDLLESHLHRLGWAVDRAESGEQGVSQALAAPPAVVLVDLMLPGMDGRAVIRALRASRRTAACRLIVTSVLDPDEHGVEADGVLGKPFTARDVRRAVGVA